jgi:hypothetical protein
VREFFRGWRRKAGLVTLVISVALVGAWMRSAIIADVIQLKHEDSYQFIGSMLGSMRWSRWTSPSVSGPQHSWVPSFVWDSHDANAFQGDAFEEAEVDWRWKWLGFEFLHATIRRPSGMNGQTSRWSVPYWSLVLPLTVVSAWLLISKPRAAKSAKESNRA